MSNDKEIISDNSDGYYKSQERKASDVLLSIEKKIDNLSKIVSLYDMNIKIILDRVNKIHNYIEKLQIEYNIENSGQDDGQNVINTSEPLIQMDNNPKGIRRTSRNLPTQPYVENIFPQENEPKIGNKNIVPEASQQQIQESNFPVKKVPVQQRITDRSGKDVFMADIVIFDQTGKQLHKCKTNAAGKWQAMLNPGNYKIKLTKTDTTTKNKIELEQDIEIPSSNATVQLRTAIINK